MELNDNKNIAAEVIGFGCPALLSKSLSEETMDYITTVIADSDLIPRTSGATITNFLLNVMEYNWIPNAKRDIDHAFEELLRVSPGILSTSSIDNMTSMVNTMLQSYVAPTIKPATTDRVKPILFPPGRCIHIYRDGSGVSGCVSPCTFFGEIDMSRRMIQDHKIKSGYRQIFLELMRQVHDDPHFKFEEKGSEVQ
jgi:hypothetical protein